MSGQKMNLPEGTEGPGTEGPGTEGPHGLAGSSDGCPDGRPSHDGQNDTSDREEDQVGRQDDTVSPGVGDTSEGLVGPDALLDFSYYLPNEASELGDLFETRFGTNVFNELASVVAMTAPTQQALDGQLVSRANRALIVRMLRRAERTVEIPVAVVSIHKPLVVSFHVLGLNDRWDGPTCRISLAYTSDPALVVGCWLKLSRIQVGSRTWDLSYTQDLIDDCPGAVTEPSFCGPSDPFDPLRRASPVDIPVCHFVAAATKSRGLNFFWIFANRAIEIFVREDASVRFAKLHVLASSSSSPG